MSKALVNVADSSTHLTFLQNLTKMFKKYFCPRGLEAYKNKNILGIFHYNLVVDASCMIYYTYKG
jgi:hypothetical protein